MPRINVRLKLCAAWITLIYLLHYPQHKFHVLYKNNHHLLLYYFILLHATPGKQPIPHKCFSILDITPMCMMEQPKMKIAFIQALHRSHIYAWSSWCCLCIVRKRLTLLHRNQWDLCWPTRRITYQYAYEWNSIFGMLVIGGLCIKLCNCVALELLVLPEHCQNAFETTTPDPTRFMLTDSAHYISIYLWMVSNFWNGCNWRFVHKIMQFCCFGAAGTSCT